MGEAPGATEVETGIPFSGRSGALLQALVKRAGLYERLADATVTNVVACRPPDNRKPYAEERRECADRLDAELADKDIVIALGKTAGTALLGRRESVREMRLGPPEHVDENEDYPNLDADVLVTYHPAAALRMPRRQGDIISDLRKLEATPDVWTEPRYEVAHRPQRIIEVLNALPAGDTPLALDIETAGSPEHAIPQPRRLRCVGLATQVDKVVVIPGDPLRNDPMVKRAFEDALKRRPVLCHNGKFDLQALGHLGFEVPPLGADTMLAAYALDERPGGKGLQQLAREVLGAPAWKDEVSGMDPDTLHEYNARDVAATLQLWHELKPRLDDEGVRGLHDDLLVPSSDLLASVEYAGMRVDQEAVQKSDEQLSQRVDELEAATQRWVDNPRSWQQIQAAFDELGHPVPNTQAETLERVTQDAEGEPAALAQAILDYRSEHKLYSTYISALPDYIVDGRIHSNLSLHKTETGRLSSRDPNLQNQPKIVRKMFVPEPGDVFVEGDLASAELRVIGVESGDAELLGILAGDRKLHSVLAERIWGPDFTDDHYRLAKTVVYGVAYGRSAYGMAKGLNIPKAEASKVRNEYLEMVPTMADWQDDVRGRVFEGDELRTKFGRKLRLPKPTKFMDRWKRNELVRRGLAFIPQSTASDITLTAALRLYEQGWDIRMLVHDSILLNVKPERASAAQDALREAVRDAGRAYTDEVPFPVDVDEPKDRW